jgi:hypothetical protein
VGLTIAESLSEIQESLAGREREQAEPRRAGQGRDNVMRSGGHDDSRGWEGTFERTQDIHGRRAVELSDLIPAV